ncbi:FkbM family methyltransferase [Lacrimispora sphenoides]|uniref:Methyltransferase, FkbM family n=1 Tax=Lacrimispora sphenoides JCM 1415 TaxID=1297793 RepID=A0ABY1CDD6_9FIRM|nr:FkbM family methyltransferase [Lacrimispora sphenoides]SET93908.1 methyltransferase, FkbM family [[Clostridium] sphenoides JCM 1415]SUY52534.1 FkbM family methyltransferase [Lacrimispora sphenoides]
MESFRKEYDIIQRQWNGNLQTADQAFREFEQKVAGRPLVLFGAAWIGDFVYERLVSRGIEITCFCDNFVKGVTPAGHTPIITADELIKMYPTAVVIITNDKACFIIRQQLLDLGFGEDQLLLLKQLDHQQLDLQQFSLDQLQPYIDGYERMYDFFTDEISKQIIIARMKSYLFGTSIKKSDSPQYFEKGIIQLSEHEVFVDGGFFTGDTAEEFIRQTNGKFNYYYGFEPDILSREKARKNLSQYECNSNIEVIPRGLHSKQTKLKFASSNGAQASGGTIIEDADITGDNVVSVDVTSLDHFFANTSEVPTFIKMDIEGAEKNALLGAKNVIQTAKPKLAICVYHKPEDLYELTELIHSYNPDYKFVLRHYAHYFWETVLYAV